MRSASTSLASLAVFLSTLQIATGIAHAGSVDVQQSALLNADVTAVLGDPANPADSKESHDSGDVLKPNVSAQATASATGDSGAFTGTGASELHLSSTDDGFVLTGKSSAALTGTSTLAGEVRSTARFDLSFTIEDGFHASPQLSATMNTMVVRDAKVTLVIDRPGESQAIFVKTFDDSFGGPVAPLDAGSYHLQLITSSIATAKGIPGETESAGFDFSVAATPVSEPPPAIPLPASFWGGGVLLAAALIARKHLGGRLY